MSDSDFPEDIPVETYPYHWDLHMRLERELDQLDRMERKISRNEMDTGILQRLILKGPYGSEPKLNDMSSVDGNVLREYMVSRLQRLTGMLYRHINLTQTRADVVVRSAESLAAFFPEGKYLPGLVRMTDAAALQVRDLGERLHALREVIYTDAAGGIGEDMLTERLREISSLQQSFQDSSRHDDPSPVSTRTPVLEEDYHRLSNAALRQALVQKNIASECLSVVTTDMVLREIFRMRSSTNVDSFKNLATTMMMGAMVDLEYALDLRKGIYLMTQTNRPVFPPVSFLG